MNSTGEPDRPGGFTGTFSGRSSTSFNDNLVDIGIRQYLSAHRIEPGTPQRAGSQTLDVNPLADEHAPARLTSPVNSRVPTGVATVTITTGGSASMI